MLKKNILKTIKSFSCYDIFRKTIPHIYNSVSEQQMVTFSVETDNVGIFFFNPEKGACELNTPPGTPAQVFLKYYHIEELAQKYEHLARQAVRVQAYLRMRIARVAFYKLRWKREKAVLVIQRC